jgi:hypothetical protein
VLLVHSCKRQRDPSDRALRLAPMRRQRNENAHSSKPKAVVASPLLLGRAPKPSHSLIAPLVPESALTSQRPAVGVDLIPTDGVMP